ncbi:hypothetical protein [Sediminibacillus massiliensis]|uniref:hypothetical protein n=1 Tax=Sediminibacillus massiliensis TaxID=1926277 RepID=UPI0015C38CAF|nr:hypothetical protein [Sediminibacillus massiliensis]
MKLLKEFGWALIVAAVLILIPFKVIGPDLLEEESPKAETNSSEDSNYSID